MGSSETYTSENKSIRYRFYFNFSITLYSNRKSTSQDPVKYCKPPLEQ